MTDKLPSITIIFPTLNGSQVIDKLIQSITQQTYPGKLIKVIAVDNHSSDNTVSIIKKYPWVKLLRYKKNTGSAPPLTLAAKQANTQFVLITNDDVYFDKNCLINLIKLALSNPKIGITTGKMLYANYPHEIALPGFRINHYLGYYPYDLTNINSVRYCDFAPGSCMLIRLQLLKQLNYFDNEYIFCGDDYDLCYQVKRCGYKIIYQPSSIYYHVFSRNYTQNGKKETSLFFHYRGKIRYILKNLSIIQIISSLIFQVIVGPAFTYLKFRNKTFKPMLQAFYWNMKHIKRTLIKRSQSKLTAQKIAKNKYLLT